jgi:hypothetical protein
MGLVVNATPRPLYPRYRLGTLCIGGLVGFRAGLDWCGKSRPPPEFDPRSVQPVASRYTCAIPTQQQTKHISIKTEVCVTSSFIFRWLPFARCSVHDSHNKMYATL